MHRWPWNNQRTITMMYFTASVTLNYPAVTLKWPWSLNDGLETSGSCNLDILHISDDLWASNYTMAMSMDYLAVTLKCLALFFLSLIRRMECSELTLECLGLWPWNDLGFLPISVSQSYSPAGSLVRNSLGALVANLSLASRRRSASPESLKVRQGHAATWSHVTRYVSFCRSTTVNCLKLRWRLCSLDTHIRSACCKDDMT